MALLSHLGVDSVNLRGSVLIAQLHHKVVDGLPRGGVGELHWRDAVASVSQRRRRDPRWIERPRAGRASALPPKLRWRGGDAPGRDSATIVGERRGTVAAHAACSTPQLDVMTL